MLIPILASSLSQVTVINISWTRRLSLMTSTLPGKQSSKGWRTVLLGAFGAGGKGLFALDVTNPAISESASSDEVLWEFTDLDDTYPTDSDGNAITPGARKGLMVAGCRSKIWGLVLMSR